MNRFCRLQRWRERRAKATKILRIAISVLAGLHALETRADDLLDTGQLHGDAAAGAMYSTDARNYGVLIHPRWQPVLELNLDFGRFYAGTDHGFGFKAIAIANLTLGVGLDLRPGRKESADSAYQALGSIADEPIATSYIEWTPFGPALTLYGDVSVGVDHSHATTYTAGVRGGVPIMNRVTVFVDGSLAGADARYAQRFYGITPSQAVASGRSAYSANAGTISGTLAAGILVDLGKNLQLIASAARFAYASDLARSPLISRRSYPEAFIATSYSF